MTTELLSSLIVPALQVAGTLVAAFGGAWAAFRFEENRRRKEDADREVGAGSRALYALFNMWNVLKQYEREAIEPAKNRGALWINLDATPPYGRGIVAFDDKDLTFLLKTEAQLFADVMMEQQRYNIAIGLIDRRSALLLEQAYPSLHAAGLKRGEDLPMDQLGPILGEHVMAELKSLTKGILKFVSEDLQSLEQVFGNLRSTLVERYPGQKFFQVDFAKSK